MTEKRREAELNEKQLDDYRSGCAGIRNRDARNSVPTRAEERGVGADDDGDEQPLKDL